MSLANKTKKERTDLPPRNNAPLHSVVLFTTDSVGLVVEQAIQLKDSFASFSGSANQSFVANG